VLAAAVLGAVAPGFGGRDARYLQPFGFDDR
jgi:hypothetical protein